MSRPRATCLACGFEGNAPRDEFDRGATVAMGLVEIPLAERVLVEVSLITQRKRGGWRNGAWETTERGYEQPIIEHRMVPGQYGAETRCTDVPACRERQRAMAAPAAQPRHDPELELAEASWFET